jgi:starch phosphorylase
MRHPSVYPAADHAAPAAPQLFPEKFQNKTNGVTPRRWLAYCNPELSALITETLGSDSWVTDTVQLQKLKKVSTDAAFQAKWKAVKQLKKAKLAAMIKQMHGDEVNMNALFDIQVCAGVTWAM